VYVRGAHAPENISSFSHSIFTTISSYIIRARALVPVPSLRCGVGAGSGKFQISQITFAVGAIARSASAPSVFAAGVDAEK
jgi:hypothetical protein